ncbi:hypothetical protein V6N13_014286 [Hibiscus sabdariffa]
MFPKKSIPAAVAVNLAGEMGKVGPNSSPSFAAILQLALQREYRDSTGKIAIRSHIRELSLTNSLVAAVGIIAENVFGDVRMTDTGAGEAKRGFSVL